MTTSLLNKMTNQAQRLLIGLVALNWCFTLVGLDAIGILDISKFGYAAIGAWATLVLQFYFRKKDGEKG